MTKSCYAFVSLVLAGTLVLLVLALPVRAQDRAELVRWCDGSEAEGISADLTIGGCTALIQSGREETEFLSGAFTNRGVAYKIKGQYDLAARDFEQAIRINKSGAQAWNDLCFVRALSGALDSALTDCKEAVKLAPDAPQPLDSLGYVYLKAGRYDQAISTYDNALKLDPTIPNSLFGRGVAELRIGSRKAGDSDIAAAKLLKADIANDFAKWGVVP